MPVEHEIISKLSQKVPVGKHSKIRLNVCHRQAKEHKTKDLFHRSRMYHIIASRMICDKIM